MSYNATLLFNICKGAKPEVPAEEEEVKDPSVSPVQNLHHDVPPGGSNRERESSSRGGTTELPSQYLQHFFTRI
jgi:hypothetical protein